MGKVIEVSDRIFVSDVVMQEVTATQSAEIKSVTLARNHAKIFRNDEFCLSVAEKVNGTVKEVSV